MAFAKLIRAVVLNGHGAFDKIVIHDDLPVP